MQFSVRLSFRLPHGPTNPLLEGPSTEMHVPVSPKDAREMFKADYSC